MSLFEAFKQALKAVFKFDANNNLKTTIAGDEVGLAKESTLSSIHSQLDIKLSELRDALKGTDNKDFTTLEADVETLVNHVAKETTLSAIKAQTDKLQFDANNFLRVALASDEVNVAKESTLSSILSQLDIKLSELRDALKGANNKDFSTLEADIESILAQLDVALSTRASESTLSAIKAQTDKLQFDSKNYLKTSTRTQIEVHDEVVQAGEVLYIPSGTEVAFNNLTINGKCIVSGRCVVLGELVIGESGELVLDDNGELVLMDV